MRANWRTWLWRQQLGDTASARSLCNASSKTHLRAERATELLPESKDAFGGPGITEGVAQVHVTLGDYDRAIELLEGLLSRPSAVTVQGLKVNPIWDPLRSNPRFQALVQKSGGKA